MRRKKNSQILRENRVHERRVVMKTTLLVLVVLYLSFKETGLLP